MIRFLYSTFFYSVKQQERKNARDLVDKNLLDKRLVYWAYDNDEPQVWSVLDETFFVSAMENEQQIETLFQFVSKKPPPVVFLGHSKISNFVMNHLFPPISL